MRHEELDGKGRQPCCMAPCPFWSVAGLETGQGLCPFHFAAYKWGLKWAMRCYPAYIRLKQQFIQNRKEAV